jgi:hypothetical protein
LDDDAPALVAATENSCTLRSKIMEEAGEERAETDSVIEFWLLGDMDETAVVAAAMGIAGVSLRPPLIAAAREGREEEPVTVGAAGATEDINSLLADRTGMAWLLVWPRDCASDG